MDASAGRAVDADRVGARRVAELVRSGRKTRKVVDQPGVSTMSTKPSWASATDLAMASPRPVPGTPDSVVEARR